MKIEVFGSYPPPPYTDYVFEEFHEKLVVKISDKVAPPPFKKRC